MSHTTASHTFEIVTFKGVAGVTAPQMIAAASGVDGWLAKQPGFVRRTFAADPSGVFVDLVEWTSIEHAQAANSGFRAAPGADGYLALIDFPSLSMRHALLAPAA